MKTILIAWELGAGAGHLVNIRRLAQRLQRDGIRFVDGPGFSVALRDSIQDVHRMRDPVQDVVASRLPC